jgi:potassium-transporting ATPase KdpC subunit
MMSTLRPAIMMMALFTLLTGLAYPLALTGFIQLALPTLANGSLVERDGKVIGSALIGQSFTTDRYFHPRPSAAGQSGYDAAASSSSNLGPLSTKLIDRVSADVALLRAGRTSTIPADAVTTSASGLDPDISPAYALMQVERVAKARGIQPADVREVLDRLMDAPFAGLIGEPGVNVLKLNLELDARRPASAG